VTQETPLQPFITVIVITRNRAEVLSDCLSSILEQDYTKDRYEVVVVDDGSTDHTSLVVNSLQTKAALPVIRYLPQPHRGTGAARNTGVKNARGEIVIFLDDDELVTSDHMTRVVRPLMDDHNLDGVGGPCRDYGGSKLHTCARCSLAAVDVPGMGKRFVPRLLSGNMALRTSVFKRIGLFDETIFGRGEDVEWFHRASGMQFFFDPDLWVWHRRDNFNFITLCRYTFEQGLSIPLAMKKLGRSYRPKAIRVIGPLAHALRYRCVRGVVLAIRELGAISGYLDLSRLSRFNISK